MFMFCTVHARQRPQVHVLQLRRVQRHLADGPKPAGQLHLQLRVPSSLPSEQRRLQPKVSIHPQRPCGGRAHSDPPTGSVFY